MLHRFREHIVKHNWFAVAVDLAIVVIGVFLATQANNWNQARIDRQRGRDYRVRLIADLKETEVAMHASRLYYIDARSHAVAALTALEQPGALGEPFLIDAYQATQVFPRQARHSTYDEILSSGGINLIGPPQIRDRLSNFYWRLDGLSALMNFTPPYRERMRSLMPYAVQQRIREQCDEVLRDEGNGMITPRLPAQCRIGLDPALVATAARKMRAAAGLDDDLTRAVVDFDTKVLNFAKLEANAREVREAVQRANTD